MYQIVGGIMSLTSLAAASMSSGMFAGAVLAIASLLNTTAGVLLLTQEPIGWRLTAVSQLVQSVGLYLPRFALCIIQGASVVTSVRFFQKASFAESLFTHVIGGSLTPVCDAAIGLRSVSLPAYGLSLNWLAGGLAIVAINRIRTAKKSTRPAVHHESVPVLR